MCLCVSDSVGAVGFVEEEVLITTGIFRLPHTASQLQLARLPSIDRCLSFFLSCDAPFAPPESSSFRLNA